MLCTLKLTQHLNSNSGLISLQNKSPLSSWRSAATHLGHLVVTAGRRPVRHKSSKNGKQSLFIRFVWKWGNIRQKQGKHRFHGFYSHSSLLEASRSCQDPSPLCLTSGDFHLRLISQAVGGKTLQLLAFFSFCFAIIISFKARNVPDKEKQKAAWFDLQVSNSEEMLRMRSRCVRLCVWAETFTFLQVWRALKTQFSDYPAK